MRALVLSSSCLVLALTACGIGEDLDTNVDRPMDSAPAGDTPDDPREPPQSPDPEMSNPTPEPTIPGERVVDAGPVSGEWNGAIRLRGRATVPAGDTLIIRAGTVVRAETAGAFEVLGTLKIEGTAENRVRFESSGWAGIVVGANGRLEGRGADVKNGTTCVDGLAGSTVVLDAMTFAGCSRGLRFANGATVTQTRILAGSTVSLMGGHLEMSDSTIEFTGPQASDCTHFGGGSARLDHVRFTACHCPIHVNRTDGPLVVTNSVFDVATYAVMIASSEATFTGNHFESSSAEFLDIGGGIRADIAGNYWGGGAPGLSSRDLTQFTGAGDYLTAPIAGVGPR